MNLSTIPIFLILTYLALNYAKASPHFLPIANPSSFENVQKLRVQTTKEKTIPEITANEKGQLNLVRSQDELPILPSNNVLNRKKRQVRSWSPDEERRRMQEWRQIQEMRQVEKRKEMAQKESDLRMGQKFRQST